VLDSLQPYEQEVHTKDGRYFLLRILPYRTSRNVIDGVVITFVDITVQHNAEQLFYQSLKYSLVATIIIDANGEMQIINERAEKLLGWTEDELRGRPVEALVPENQRVEHHRLRKKYMKSPSPRLMAQRVPLICQRKDGTQFKAEIGLAPLYTEKGTLIMANIREL
jgi:PAS domain S-box-containing protein